MQNWTCSILSMVLLCVSTFSSLAQKEDNSVINSIFSSFMGFFMGVQAQEIDKEIIVDLSIEELTDEMKIEIEGIKAEILLEESKKPQEETKKPTVILYHTHTDEAYLKGEQDYVETSTGRTKNHKFSVVGVGETFSQALQDKGFTVVHDKTDNVSAGFNKAYQTSYETIKQYIGKAEVFVDMHRDAYYGQTPNVVTYNGQEYARLCFVVANGENYSQKPNWQQNYKLAQKLTNKLNEICPGITRDIIFKNARYNQHVSEKCLLIEMGNEENTIEQVKRTAELVAMAFEEVF
ncbi:MAG: stage II sporulation protein P [Clostridia bacterium]|nr:stage II sporulation protein P [Clostridia bacterium]